LWNSFAKQTINTGPEPRDARGVKFFFAGWNLGATEAEPVLQLLGKNSSEGGVAALVSGIYE
jgi:hypothetical protein